MLLSTNKANARFIEVLLDHLRVKRNYLTVTEFVLDTFYACINNFAQLKAVNANPIE